MGGYTTKNYTAQGGSLTVIGGELQINGKLTISPDAVVEGLFDAEAQLLEAVDLGTLEAQEDSTATTVAGLKDDFNALLAKLRAAGMFADDALPSDEGNSP